MDAQQTQVLQQYKILSAEFTPELERQVEQHIRDGWRPIGGVSVGRQPLLYPHDGPTRSVYVQAMVRAEKVRMEYENVDPSGYLAHSQKAFYSMTGLPLQRHH